MRTHGIKVELQNDYFIFLSFFITPYNMPCQIRTLIIQILTLRNMEFATLLYPLSFSVPCVYLFNLRKKKIMVFRYHCHVIIIDFVIDKKKKLYN